MDAGTLELGIYRDFRGNYFILDDLATFTETGDLYVIYRSLSDGKTYVRPAYLFLSEVELNREDNVTRQRKRFQYICRNEDVIC